MDKLNNLELDMFSKLAEDYPDICAHIPFLAVSERKYTIAGMYILFIYVNESLDLKPIVRPNNSHLLTTDYIVYMNNDKEQALLFVAATTNGLIDYIELYNEGQHEWSGNLGVYRFGSRNEQPYF